MRLHHLKEQSSCLCTRRMHARKAAAISPACLLSNGTGCSARRPWPWPSSCAIPAAAQTRRRHCQGHWSHTACCPASAGDLAADRIGSAQTWPVRLPCLAQACPDVSEYRFERLCAHVIQGQRSEEHTSEL